MRIMAMAIATVVRMAVAESVSTKHFMDTLKVTGQLRVRQIGFPWFLAVSAIN
jgi:hypothetical protein